MVEVAIRRRRRRRQQPCSSQNDQQTRTSSKQILMTDSSCDLSLSQRDSYCRRSTSRVLSCAAAADGNFSVALDDSCLYPEGGGQPCDGGSVGGVAVIRVDKIPGQAGVSVTLASPLEIGSEAECAVDWPKRCVTSFPQCLFVTQCAGTMPCSNTRLSICSPQ
jgi:alanyl-tRNA synthetase